MATPVPTNRVPEHCRCWMVRGADLASRDICDTYSPNPDAIFCLADDQHEHALCLACEHLEVCHRHELVEALLDIAGGGDAPEIRKAVRSAIYDAFVPPDLRHRFEA